MNRSNFVIACWLALALGGIVAMVLPIQALIYHSPDDAFFYMKTAWNYATGLGSSFDGMNPTNGYHPLWFLVLAAMYFLGERSGLHSPEVFYRIAFLLQWAMSIGTVLLAAEAVVMKRGSVAVTDKNNASLAWLFGLMVFFLVFIRVVGSEAAISVLVLAGYLYIKQSEISTGGLKLITKSALAAFLFLSRIDYISTIVPALLLGDVFTSPREYRMKTAFILFAAVAGVAATYFAINLIHFGHLLTVSASWKSEFPRFLLFSNLPFYLRANPYQFARATLAIVVCTGFIVYIYRNRRDALKLDVFIAWLCAGAVLFMLQTMSFNAHKIREWYTTVPVFIALIVAVRVAAPIRRIPWSINIVLTVFAIAFLIGAGFLFKKWDANYQFAYTLKESIGTNEPVMIVDCAGVVGYFSGVPVINGDGLVNSFDYLEAVNNNRLDLWLAQRNVPYYATYSTAQPDSLQGGYIDWAVTGLGGMKFVFDQSQVILQAPFSIDNIRFHSTGEWTVFKLKHNNVPGR